MSAANRWLSLAARLPLQKMGRKNYFITVPSGRMTLP